MLNKERRRVGGPRRSNSPKHYTFMAEQHYDDLFLDLGQGSVSRGIRRVVNQALYCEELLDRLAQVHGLGYEVAKLKAIHQAELFSFAEDKL